jgi:hypothetical protein
MCHDEIKYVSNKMCKIKNIYIFTRFPHFGQLRYLDFYTLLLYRTECVK